MRLDRFIAKSRIVDLVSPGFEDALRELLAVSTYRLREEFPLPELAERIVTRERTMPTILGHGVAMPHLRLPMGRSYIFALGRVPNGLEFEGQPEYRDLRLVFLLLASERERNYLNVLASIARLFREPETVQRIAAAPDVATMQSEVEGVFGGVLAKPEPRANRVNRLFLRQAEKISREARCAAMLLFSDTFAGGIDLEHDMPAVRTILVTRAAHERLPAGGSVEAAIEVRSFSRQRLAQARSAILIGLTRGLLRATDRVCCVGGIPASNQLDTVVVMDIEREFQSVLNREQDILPKGVKIEVVERVIAIATELAVEGREGKPVGTLFVVGDHEKVADLVKPLVLNPFRGYGEEERNILSPFMDETVKEFSVMDGGFVIRGNGVIESAGSLIHAPGEFYANLPSGFGSRHSAAAAVSRATDCLAVCISASTGQITLFRQGVMLPLLEKPIGSHG